MLTPDKFYEQRVLGCECKRRVVELPWPRDYKEIRIEKDLFDWRLYYASNKYITCVSEWEARYLKIWLEGGVRRLEIPCDEPILKQITVDLEKIAKKIGEMAEERLAGYKEHIAREILDGVWQIPEVQS